MYEERKYRGWAHAPWCVPLCFRESDVVVYADRALPREPLDDALRNVYHAIGSYAQQKPAFHHSLSSLPPDEDAPAIVRQMLSVSRRTGIGPFAAVAGAVAQAVGETARTLGAREILVENGGDVYLWIQIPKTVGVYAGEQFPVPLEIRVPARKRPFGIASSSARIGHSLNLGRADLVTVIAASAPLADGFATAYSNRVRTAADAQKVLARAKARPDVYGILVCVEDRLFLQGEIELSG
ncbi:MAG: hypothetical protein GF333_01890 [Candidatus Omnitrophica bacterium]|nr:hypothetical protein [Candidatus Omnitrophota bacterium]